MSGRPKLARYAQLHLFISVFSKPELEAFKAYSFLRL